MATYRNGGMSVFATHKDMGRFQGGLYVIEISDEEQSFILLLDQGLIGENYENAPDKNWTQIERPTLSEVCDEAKRLGFSDVTPN